MTIRAESESLYKCGADEKNKTIRKRLQLLNASL